MQFKLSKKSSKSNARLGYLETDHGVLETPCLIPVATQATIKTLDVAETERAKCQGLISNTFWLHLRPGEDVIANAGGVHEFMRWKRPLMTDSGGYQVFSLGFMKDLGLDSKIHKEGAKEAMLVGKQPQRLKINEDGVTFRSPINGDELFLGPRESIYIQEKIGADIIFAFDECPPPAADERYIKQSLAKTHKWAQICLKAKKTNQALYGIVQGSRFKELRLESAKFIGKMDFEGFGIGGEFGVDKTEMSQMLGWVTKKIPERKPRHLLGVGAISDLEMVIKAGMDTFDCTIPTHYARRGIAFTSEGKLDLRQTKYLNMRETLDKTCVCEVCLTYTKDYICHLIKAGEITGLKLLTFHNLYYFNTLIEVYRQKIRDGKL